jgi:hypothetical protein
MLRFLCCAFCALLVSPALALDVYKDLTLTLENQPSANEVVNVFGTATLTIDGALVREEIKLRDSAKLVVNSGTVRGGIHVFGDNEIVQYGGIVRDNVLFGFGEGLTTVRLLGGKFPASMNFSNPLGTQDVFADMDGMEQLPVNINAPDSSDVSMKLVYVGEQPHYSNMSGFLAVGDLRVGHTKLDFPVQDQQNVSRIDWTLTTSLDVPSGDTNRDGVVDLADLNAVRNMFGVHGPSDMSGDTAPYDAVVDLNDLNRVRNDFGMSSNPIPEPSTLTVALLGMLALAGIPLRRRYWKSPLRFL